MSIHRLPLCQWSILQGCLLPILFQLNMSKKVRKQKSISSQQLLKRSKFIYTTSLRTQTALCGVVALCYQHCHNKVPQRCLSHQTTILHVCLLLLIYVSFWLNFIFQSSLSIFSFTLHCYPFHLFSFPQLHVSFNLFAPPVCFLHVIPLSNYNTYILLQGIEDQRKRYNAVYIKKSK